MVLVPMQDAGQRHILLQLPQRDPHARCPESDALRRIADAEHRHPFPCDERLVAQRLQRITPPVVFGNHPQAGRTTIHAVQLGVMGETVYWHVILLLIYNPTKLTLFLPFPH